MKIWEKRLVFAVSFILTIGVTAVLCSEKVNNLKTSSLCDLVEHWKDYDQHTIRVRAIYSIGAESEVLYDPSCQRGKDIAYVRIRDDVKGSYKALDSIVTKDKSHRRAWVVLEGIFRGPEPYTNRDLEQIPERLREHFRGGHRRYGHMGMFDYMLDVTKVVSANAVTDKQLARTP